MDVLLRKVIYFSEEKFLIFDFNVLKKFQKSNDKICPWPLCTGSKHERHSRVFLSLAIPSSPSPPTLYCEGGLMLYASTCGGSGRAGWLRAEKILVGVQYVQLPLTLKFTSRSIKVKLKNKNRESCFILYKIIGRIMKFYIFSVSSAMTFRSAGKRDTMDTSPGHIFRYGRPKGHLDEG